jgi:hypothetical protein
MNKLKIGFLSLIILAFACSKGGDSTPVTPPAPKVEAPVTFSVTQDPGTGNILGVVGTSQTINVRVNSTIPTAGMNIEVTVRKDVDNTVVFTNTSSSVAADNSVVITGLTPGVLCTASVIVTSKSTTTNNKTVAFKLAAK